MKKLWIFLLLTAIVSCTKEYNDSGVLIAAQTINDTLELTGAPYSYALKEKSAWEISGRSSDALVFDRLSGTAEEAIQVRLAEGSDFSEGWFEITHATGTQVEVKVKRAAAGATQTVTVLQLNIWQEGTMITGGYEAITNEIVRSGADFVTLSEVRNYGNIDFTARLTGTLKEKGVQYYSSRSDDSGVLSRYPIVEFSEVYPNAYDNGTIYKLVSEVGRTRFAMYTCHLDYTHYACYLPRAYDGVSFGKLDEPVTDVNAIKKMNLNSLRDEEIAVFIADAALEREKGSIVMLGGDFNEPSHLDWTVAVKNMYDHNGVVYNWDSSLALQNAGFTDSYRSVHPSPVTHPGFTYPSDNADAEIARLSWAPESDERDRIDFIYFYPDVRLKLESAELLGPSRSIVRGVRTAETSRDTFIEPLGTWPSDHKGLICRFTLQEK